MLENNRVDIQWDVTALFLLVLPSLFWWSVGPDVLQELQLHCAKPKTFLIYALGEPLYWKS